MEFHDVNEAYRLNLIQYTHWLEPTIAEITYLQKEFDRISKDKTRIIIAVRNSLGQVALFFNDITKE